MKNVNVTKSVTIMNENGTNKTVDNKSKFLFFCLIFNNNNDHFLFFFILTYFISIQCQQQQ